MKTYNFIEACNSGKKFKFKNCPEWCNDDDFHITRFWIKSLTKVYFDNYRLDILNSEFILEEKKVEITESQLEEAIKESRDKDDIKLIGINPKKLAKRLGL